MLGAAAARRRVPGQVFRLCVRKTPCDYASTPLSRTIPRYYARTHAQLGITNDQPAVRRRARDSGSDGDRLRRCASRDRGRRRGRRRGRHVSGAAYEWYDGRHVARAELDNAGFSARHRGHIQFCPQPAYIGRLPDNSLLDG